MKGLTLRQREVFDFIREFIRLNRYPPTIREIATKGAECRFRRAEVPVVVDGKPVEDKMERAMFELTDAGKETK